MRPIRLVALAFLALALLAACAGGPPKRVYPPQASVSELRATAAGEWELALRIRNFSTVPMDFNRMQATLVLAGGEATRFDINPALTVGPGSAEVVVHRFSPPAAVRAAVQEALAARRPVPYSLSGRLASREPGTDDEFEYTSRLDPVPGLEGVLR